MYNFAKRLTAATSILGVLNAFIVLVTVFYLSNSGLDASSVIIVSIYLITSTAITLLLTLALRGLCNALELNFANDTERTRELQKRVTALEKNKNY